jgi:hypothetical protein
MNYRLTQWIQSLNFYTMHKLESHGLGSKREFSGEESCRGVIAWLNEPQDDPGRRRIRQLLRSIQILANNWVEVIDEDDGATALAHRGDAKEYKKAYKDAFTLLRRYRFSPLLFPFAYRMICQWTPIAGPAGHYRGQWPPIGPYTEYSAVIELTWNFGENLAKVKECFCGRWFFLRFAHKKFCSSKCRDKANKTLPQAREYRRKKAREYYWLHKNKNTK